MIKDKLLEFVEAQVLTATAVSTNIIDTLAAGDFNSDGEMFLVVRTGTVLDSAAEGAILTVSLQDSDIEAFSSPRTVVTYGAVAETAMVGNQIIIKARLPLGLQRFLRVNFAVSGESFTTGTIDAFLVSGVDTRMP